MTDRRETVNPVMQKPNGCYAACIASLTGISLDDIPHPIPHPTGGNAFTRESWSEYRNILVKFLKDRDWWIVHLWANAPAGYSIISGTSPRGIGHACVALDGKIVHDPYPDGGGLVSVHEYEVLIRLVRNKGNEAEDR